MSIPPDYETRKCIAPGCGKKYPPFGLRASKDEPAKYACFEHRHLLGRASAAEPATAPAPVRKTSSRDLFSRKD